MRGLRIGRVPWLFLSLVSLGCQSVRVSPTVIEPEGPAVLEVDAFWDGDEGKTPFAGLSVRLQVPGSVEVVREASTSADGPLVITGLLPGTYVLYVYATEKELVRQPVQVFEGHVTSISLDVAAIEAQLLDDGPSTDSRPSGSDVIEDIFWAIGQVLLGLGIAVLVVSVVGLAIAIRVLP